MFSAALAIFNMRHVNDNLALVPPTDLTISADPDDYVIQGNVQTLTCRTDSFNPETSLTVQWERNNESISSNHSITRTIDDGLHNGKRLTSVYRFTADKTDHNASFSCSLIWNADDVIQRRDRSIVVYCGYHHNFL